MSDKGNPIDPQLVQQFVGAAHANIQVVKECLAAEPSLIKASWDWGSGDWETGLEAASHMGNAEIIGYLLEQGATNHVFCAAKRDSDIVEVFQGKLQNFLRFFVLELFCPGADLVC